jgi:hypothetical protein
VRRQGRLRRRLARGIEHLTIVTCDRCNSETRYDASTDRRWQADWASTRPATIVPYGERPPRSTAESIICASCLTDAEREQLEQTRLCLQYDEQFPF